jgi:2-dehydro-3-deoxygluconokinase
LKPEDLDWASIFDTANGARWFHTGGIFAALSDTAIAIAVEAMDAARQANTPISYDLNFANLSWKSIGGKTRAPEVNRSIAPGIS